MKTTFLYTLSDPRTGEVRYLGKSDSPFTRFRKHLSDGNYGRGHKNCWVRSLKRAGFRPAMDLLDEVPGSQWKFWEREYIRVFKAIGIRLLNLTEGGEGFSEGARKQGGRKKGAKLPELHRLRIGAAHKGKTISEEERKRLGSLRRGLPTSDKQKEAASRANSHPKSEETKQNMRVAQILRRTKERGKI